MISLRRYQETSLTDLRSAYAAGYRPAERLRTMTYRQVLQWAGHDEARLRLVARARGYKRGWVWHRLNDLDEGGAA